MPLHEAGPATKLVQSLTPMWEVITHYLKFVRLLQPWMTFIFRLRFKGPGSTFKVVLFTCSQEERLRTGENGPAGVASALRPSPDRFLPPPSALEQALRDSLFQIVQDEERFHHFELRNEQFLKSTQEMLLECSQAANTVRSEVGVQELDRRLDTKSIGAQGWLKDEDEGSSGEKSVLGQGSQDELVNEHVIRSQLTPQSRASQVWKV